MKDAERRKLLKSLGIGASAKGASFGKEWYATSGDMLEVRSPTDGALLAKVEQASAADYERLVKRAHKGFFAWRDVPAPKRGEIVRQVALALREKKEFLGRLVSLEMGKILSEGLGEVQEMIDICDFAVGQSRCLSGPTIQSERPGHRIMEQWHPLGPIGVVTAFNFPVAVWAWNAALAWICGDAVIWKPSSKTPLCALAGQEVVLDVFRRNKVPEGVSCVLVGRGSTVGELLIADRRVPLISSTGSTRMGKRVGEVVGARLGRTILELGGNNALIISDKADIKGALASALFGAVGTAGQRCTTTRRLIIHQKIFDTFVKKLVAAYKKVPIGDPLDSKTLMGPLIDEEAVEAYEKAIKAAKKQGGKVLCGAKVLKPPFGRRTFVKPTIIQIRNNAPIVQEETFAPILYVMKYRKFDEALAMHNAVPQGLSSAVYTDSLAEAEAFVSPRGSDCGLANINVGTSGAEIGGAFGGEKDTGGGRESGSDAWKAYMRRQTNTINYGGRIELAQGVEFDL